jgi:c-di-GMP-binding flagellar brake protein YcgR
MERRKRTRVKLKMPCHIAAPAEAASTAICQKTEDVSRTGMLIRWEAGGGRPPRVGEALTAEIQLPANPQFGERVMHFRGRVVRVSKAEGNALMIAVQAGRSRFRAPKPAREAEPACAGYVN